MSSGQRLWIGYSHDGGRATIELGDPGSRMLLLGAHANDLAAIVALAAKEAGAAPVILDLGGSLARQLSGCFDTFDYHAYLYDAFRLEEQEAWHSQLAAAAYTVALDLSSEEEAIINSAMQVVASDGTLLSPVSLRDVLGKVDGFRGFYVDKLSGRVGSLKLFDAVDDQTFDRLLAGNVLVDFHAAPYPQAAELAATLFIAKIISRAHARSWKDGFLLATDSHRIFRASPKAAHSNRLLTHLLDWEGTLALSTPQQQALSPTLIQGCPVRVFSSDAWHSQPGEPENILSGTFLLYDKRSETKQTFVPRRVASKTADYVSARAGRFPSPDLTRMILEDVDRFPLSTPASIVQFVSPEYLPADVSSVLASLEKQGCLILEPKESDSGSRVFAYTVSEKGRKLLEELRG